LGSSKSFSEIENTKQALQALSSQFITETRINSGRALPFGHVFQSEISKSRLISDLEKGRKDFRGTAQERVILHELLLVLQQKLLTL